MVNQTLIKNKIASKNEAIALVLVDPKDYQNSITSIVKHFTENRKMPGVYLTVNKPFRLLNDVFKNNKINTEMIIFIDAITNAAEEVKEEHDHCYYLESPESLSDMSIAISQAVEAIEHKEKFIFIDSLSTLLVYNKQETVIRFIHFLIGKMRSWNVNGVILSLKKRGEASLMAELSQFCDATIRL